jgi:Ca-activated chloride channel family protein
MSFVALSMTQALLLAALTAGAVLVLFFLKLRHRRVVVGSSLLWQRILDHRDSVSLWEKLRRWISFAVALTIALLIALALGRPYFIGTFEGPIGPVIVVLDTSPSMETRTASGQTRWDLAVDETELILSSHSGSGFMVADTSGRVLTLLTEDRNEISSAIRRMRPFGGTRKFPTIPEENARVYFITDGVDPVEVPESVTRVSVFESADNVGITAFDVQVDPTSQSGYMAYLEVVNYSDEAKDARVLLSGVGGQRLTQDLILNPEEPWSISLDLADFQGGGMRVSVQAPGDAFTLDDVAFSYLPTPTNNQVTLVTDSVNGYLETLLELSPRVELSVVRPADFENDPSTDAYVFESFVPDEYPTRPSLVFGSGGVDWLPNQIGNQVEPVITTWNEDHPVMRSVPVYDLKIDESQVLDLSNDSEGRTVVAASEETPLIVVQSGMTGPRTVFVAFDLAASDFAFHLGFPIFVENVMAWFSGEGLAERHSLGAIELPPDTTSVTRLDGTEVSTEIRFGRQVIEATEADLYTAISEGRRIRVTANLTDSRLSNVNQTSITSDSGLGLDMILAGNELWSFMLFAALLLVGLEWWTYNRRITL